ncbi:MAG TPA: hypothetical protein VH063_05435 [Gaiellaceae bacterium]|jgi:hypothetical protein|nr:hypothetical protein [Gaiellaceae bacterium]
MRVSVGLGVCMAIIGLTGCGYQLGTPDVGTARILNDTSHSVLLWQCGANDCRKPRSFPQRYLDDTFYDKFELAPGEESGPLNIADDGVPNPYLVLRPNPAGMEDQPVDPDKQRIGCLPFVMPHYVKEGLVARVSERVPCQSSLDEDVQWPPPRG